MTRMMRMAVRGLPGHAAVLALGLMLAAAVALPAWAAHLVTLYRFHGVADGIFPNSPPVVGEHGEIYGMTEQGGDPACSIFGSSGCGAVYRLTPPSTPGGKWTETVLHAFKGRGDGIANLAGFRGPGLTIGEDGSLYGTTRIGGGVSCSVDRDDGCGTAFRLSPPAGRGGEWTETILHRFGGAGDGFLPTTALLPGENGIFYGATTIGGDLHCNPGHDGDSSCGTVYVLMPPKLPGHGWTEKIIYAFHNPSEGYPSVDLTARRTVIYGSADSLDAGGSVFRLTPPGAPGGEWSYQRIYAFPCSGPVGSASGLIVRPGAIYGTTALNKCFRGSGTVFALAPPARPGGMLTIDILHRFGGRTHGDGARPTGDLVAGRNGMLFGVTGLGGGGSCLGGCGTVWQLAPPAEAGGEWAETVLYAFTRDSNGTRPAGIAAGRHGVLYGTTSFGGDGACHAGGGCGTVFKLVP